MLTINLNLRSDVEEEARMLGLLTSEKLEQMIEAEVQRQRKEAWVRLQVLLAPVQAAFREEFGHLSDEDAQALIDEWIDEAHNQGQPDGIKQDV